VTSLAKPCCSRLIIVSSGEVVERLSSCLRATKSRMYTWNVGHFFVYSGSQVGSHISLISSLSEDSYLLFCFVPLLGQYKLGK